MFARLHPFLLDPQGGEGNSSSTTDDKGGDKAPDLVKAVENLVAKHGDTTAALRVLLGENYSYRDQLRDARAKIPADGTLILAGDDVKAWQAYRDLGKPEDLGKLKADYSTASSRLKGLEREAELRGVVEHEKTRIDGAPVKLSVLRDLAGDRLTFAAGKVKKDGKEVEGMTVKDGDADPVLFEDYFKKHKPDYIPALKDAKVPPPGTPPRGNGTLPPLRTDAQPTSTAPSRSLSRF